jgi:ribosomal protein S18 acetylase RimI-like enzyme
VFRRPDGRTFTRDPTDVADTVDVYAAVDGDLEPWLAAGFVEHRRENRYVVWTNAQGAPPPPPGISLVTSTRFDWATRLGFVGVARDHRRRGIGTALLGRVFAVLAARGVAEVTTEIDLENVASRRTIEPLGTRVVGQNVELVRRIR